MNNETVSLAFNDLDRGGSSDKVYHLDLIGYAEGYTVVTQYGRRGSALATQNKATLVPYEKAKKIFDKVIREKMAKGYTLAGSAPAPQVAPSGTAVDYKMPELLEEITNGQGPDKYLNNDDYWMQDKSDGVSRGIVKAGGEIFGINKLGKPVPLPAELVEELSTIKLDSFQLDAELVGMRLICRDLLVANDDISEQPYHARFATLVCAIEARFQYVKVVETWKDKDKAVALAQQRKERREGVVFKLKSAPYRPGRNGQHKKYKFLKTLSAICGEPHSNGKQSVELFVVSGSSLVRCGTICLIGKPAVKKGDVVEVQYLYAHRSGLMVQARMKCLRNDVTPDQCLVSQLIFKREETDL